MKEFEGEKIKLAMLPASDVEEIKGLLARNNERIDALISGINESMQTISDSLNAFAEGQRALAESVNTLVVVFNQMVEEADKVPAQDEQIGDT